MLRRLFGLFALATLTLALSGQEYLAAALAKPEAYLTIDAGNSDAGLQPTRQPLRRAQLTNVGRAGERARYSLIATLKLTTDRPVGYRQYRNGPLLIQLANRRNDATPLRLIDGQPDIGEVEESELALSVAGHYWLVFIGPSEKVIFEGGRLRVKPTANAELWAKQWMPQASDFSLGSIELNRTARLIDQSAANHPASRIRTQAARLAKILCPPTILLAYANPADFPP